MTFLVVGLDNAGKSTTAKGLQVINEVEEFQRVISVIVKLRLTSGNVTEVTATVLVSLESHDTRECRQNL